MADGPLKILFAGQSWLGSCARSLREALARRDDLELEEINEDGWFPNPRSYGLRVVNRLTRNSYVREFERDVLNKAVEYRPDVFMTYKGSLIRAELIARLKSAGIYCVNVYPDCSPHAHGSVHKRAVGEYDLVISTKAYHPPLWKSVYGYANDCLFVPQGYDPLLHLVDEPVSRSDFDVVMVATYRQEYGDLASGLAYQLGDGIKVAIGGNGWEKIRSGLPRHWEFVGGVGGRSYVSLLRRGKVCIAPLTRNMVVGGQTQPGDVDTTRSYELAAAHCFFLHLRTDFAESLYGPDEVPMFGDAAELAGLVRHYLAHPADRERMAAAAHRRAVPAYSLDARAGELIGLLHTRVPQVPDDPSA